MDRISGLWTDLLGRATTFWATQQRQTRMLILGVGGALLLAIAAFGTMYAIKRADYGTLFSNLSAEDASSVTQKLKDDKVPYQLADDGATVKVPSADVSQERIALAGSGALKGNGNGYELFDRMNFGMTEFEEKIDKTRATEGELQRTIAGLTPVSAARVHIASPDPSLYTENQAPVTASIAITTKPGMNLSPGEVRGIVQLVSGAVENLKPEDVTIVNQDGIMLLPETTQANDAASNAFRLTQDQLVAKTHYEQNLQASIQSLLDSTVGPKHVAVRVATDMNFDSESTKSDEYAKEPVTRSEQIEKEKYTGTGRPQAGGVPGTTTNVIGTYQGLQNNAGSGNYQRSKITRNNEISVIHRDHVNAPGKVNHTSVAVLVNVPATQATTGTYALSQQNIAQIRNIVIAAAGLNLATGDQVSVEAIPFNPSVLVDASGTSLFLGLPVWALIAIGVILAMAAAGVIALQMRRKAGSTGGFGGGADGFPSFDASLDAEMPSFEGHPMLDGQPSLAAPMLSAAEITREQMIEYVTAIAQDRPDNIAKLIKIWLAE